MSKVVQEALRNALDNKGDRLVRDVEGVVHRYRNEYQTGMTLAASNFIVRTKLLISTYEAEAAEIDAAMQRDRDAGR